uniref:Antimicrobial peptide n=1 Tax=Ciona intestinalis TaxID=7719 RepID=F6PTP2_CIOIN
MNSKLILLLVLIACSELITADVPWNGYGRRRVRRRRRAWDQTEIEEAVQDIDSATIAEIDALMQA